VQLYGQQPQRVLAGGRDVPVSAGAAAGADDVLPAGIGAGCGLRSFGAPGLPGSGRAGSDFRAQGGPEDDRTGQAFTKESPAGYREAPAGHQEAPAGRRRYATGVTAAPHRGGCCGRSSMAELQPSKLVMRVRFPSPAPVHWLFSTTCRCFREPTRSDRLFRLRLQITPITDWLNERLVASLRNAQIILIGAPQLAGVFISDPANGHACRSSGARA
jgi:hypothetical protein